MCVTMNLGIVVANIASQNIRIPPDVHEVGKVTFDSYSQLHL